MPSYARLGRAAALTVGAALGLAGAGAVAALRRPLPRTAGRLALPGLSAPVEVIRDRWGVPHIYAHSFADLFMAQGFVHAQDRLWQMEFQRRLGHGQLAEVFGPIALDSDRFLRVLGFSRVARREAGLLAGEARAAVEAYVAGINAFITRNRTRLPIEFAIMRFRPRPWEPADVLVWGKVMALSLSENWKLEVLRARIVAAFGPERAAALDPRYPDDHPLAIPAEARYGPAFGARALAAAAATGRFAPEGGGQGSNAWVVNGSRALGGKPLLADDPHLSITMPSIWYENHLSGGGIHVTGASFPGTPGVIIGHNERIAWGVTNVMADVQDLYIERFDPDDPLRYQVPGGWARAEVVHEEIRVRGRAAPVIEAVRITRHGPIIDALVPGAAHPAANGAPSPSAIDRPAFVEALAMRWTALEPGHILAAVLNLNRAHDWESFRAALADWTVPPQNFVYADVDGHIGYATGGAIPLRARGDGRLPVPGWTGEYEWTGVIPPDELPHVLDPAEGMLVTANNRIAAGGYPHPFEAEWLNGYRAARIRDLLARTPQHDATTFARIHSDVRSLPGLELAALAGRLPTLDATARRARDLLAGWDGELSVESVAGTLYARLRDKLLAAAYREVGDALGTTAGLGAFASRLGDEYLLRALPQVLRRAAARDDAWLPAGRTWDDVLAEAWQAALAELRAEFGEDVDAWRYGRWHQLTIRHALGSVPGLARLLNRGPFPRGGDPDTVCQAYTLREFVGPPFFVNPSYRQICDTGDWDRSYSIHPTGQSGHPASRHYDDLLQPWLEGRYHPMLWSRARVDEAAQARLTLAP
jgi:penicillin amidase